MTKSPGGLIILSIGLFLLGLIGVAPVSSEPQDKEATPEKPTPRVQHPPGASDSQPTPSKPSTEVKPQTQPTTPAKADSSTDHKETVPEKPAPRLQQSPAATEGQPSQLKPSTEAKPQTQPTTPTKADSSTDHKETVPEKPAPRLQQSPAATEGQPSQLKPSTEAKPQTQPTTPTKADSSTDHKETVPEKPAPRPQQSPAASEGQPSQLKPSTEAKPQTPPTSPTKADSLTDHKEAAPEKPTPRPQHPPAASESQPMPSKPSTEAKPQTPTVPIIKTDLPPQPEHDMKEKEPVAKKPLGSLILSVKLALIGNSRLFHYEIEVEDDKQTITLAGRVSNEEDKAAATEIAQAVPGVKTVVNKLAVDKDLAKTLLKKQDEILTTLIKERFSKSATLKAANFEVKTEDGVVQLNGTVRFQVIALEAAEAARQVPGVRAVNTERIRLEGES